jgi:hypothetical protein
MALCTASKGHAASFCHHQSCIIGLSRYCSLNLLKISSPHSHPPLSTCEYSSSIYFVIILYHYTPLFKEDFAARMNQFRNQTEASFPPPGRQPRAHTTHQWEVFKPEITRLYTTHKLTDVIEIMKQEFSFWTT